MKRHRHNRPKAPRSVASGGVTMDDIARVAKVSKATVSRALEGSRLVKPATMARIVAVARKHGYTVNRNAQKLWRKRTNTIAVILNISPGSGKSISAAFLFQLLADVAQFLGHLNQDVLLSLPHVDDVHTYQSMLASKRADGIIFLGQGPDRGWLTELARTQAPFVVWGAPADPPCYCTVGSDNRRGGFLVGKRFLELGRQRILFVGNRRHPELEQRRRGLEEAIGSKQGGTVIVDLDIPDFSYETSYAESKAWLAAQTTLPDAVFAISDLVAIGVIAALRDARLRIPEDISVVGYNDTPYAAHLSPSLTTVRQDTQQAGSLLVGKLFQILEGGKPASVLLPTELIVRES
jgi:DNA-binding LacI/PurR family transcriptional regulator